MRRCESAPGLRGVLAASIALSVALLFGPGRAVATETYSAEVQSEAAEVFGSVMSPYCPGKLIANCPSPAAGELREDIRRRIAEGESAEVIREELVSTYGEAVRAAPEATGFNMLAWLIPPLSLLVGAVGVFWWMRSRAGVVEEPEAQPERSDAGDRARLREELSRLDD